MKFVYWIFLLFALRGGEASEDFYSLMGKETSRWRFVSLPRDEEELARYGALYDRQKEAQFLAEGPLKIPPDVHLIWLGPKPFPQESVENLRMWVTAHPDWHFHLWTDRPRLVPVEKVQLHRVEEFHFQRLGSYFAESTNWGQKSDLLRYELLYQRGGLYIDHDANCLRSFEGLHRGYDFYCCLEVPHTRVDGRSVTAGIGIIGTRAGHPILAGAIDAVCDHWEACKEKFPLSSAKYVREYVMHSTYLALTRSLERWLDQPENGDIVFPASYFYPQKGLKALYSYHAYGTSWADIEKESPIEHDIRKGYSEILKEQRTFLYLLEGGLLVFFILLGLMGRRWVRLR